MEDIKEQNAPTEGDRKRPRSLLESQQSNSNDEEKMTLTTVDKNNSNKEPSIVLPVPLSKNDIIATGDYDDQKEEEEPPSNRQRRILNEENIRGVKLEAVFHPKFENENLNDQQKRHDMIKKVSNGEGVLEVSLKHSGSLVLWSGSKRYYSKNATDNVHTHVAEVLLRQHFARAWMMMKGEKNDNNVDTDDISNETKYKECSKYVESHRLTLSFEVVTSVLGHHGDLPKRDFLILIAVADRSTGKFYSTTEIMQFAQRFRLPHNDAWIFQSMESATQLFDLYDNSRETGLADDVIDTLSQAADGGHVKSLYPHTVFQGQILEGIVIRFIRVGNKTEQQSLSELCLQSDKILKAVPPELVLTVSSSSTTGPNRLLKTNLRELFDGNDSSSFASSLVDIVRESTSENECTRSISRVNKKEINLPNVANMLLKDDKINNETRLICNLIKQLESLKLSVNYNVLLEQNEASDRSITQRYLCIIHILHDHCHQKFHVATRTSGGMALFRGFSFQLLTKDQAVEQTNDHSDSVVSMTLDKEMDKVKLESSGDVNIADDAKLMLKMKFLPYMVRTFICRNGLSILKKRGTIAFNEYAFEQLKKWGMSKAATDKWLGFFYAWGLYCESPSQETSDGHSLPTLSSSNYLHHLYHFETLYSSGFFNTKHKTKGSSFYGLVVVVGVDKEKITEFALNLNSILGCSRTTTNINELTEADMARAMQSEGGGIVCAATIPDGVKKLRLFGKSYKDNIFMVMIGCSKEEIEATFVESGNPNTKEMKRVVGMSNAWKKSKVSFIIDIPISSISNGVQFDTDEHLSSMVQKLKDASKSSEPDTRPGMLVFFPSIPGCGKSSLCKDITMDALNIENDRKLIMREGDKTKGKFWPLATQDKSKHPSSIFIADKNTPPASWQSIDGICSKTRGVAVCVLPDSSALEDTIVDDSFCDEYGKEVHVQHCYPFSLHFLALCMSRVLNREPNTHNGKLDAGADEACMIVVKFFCLYRNLSTTSLLRQMSNFGRANNKVIRVPFFKEGNLPEMPDNLKEILQRAICVQTQKDLKRNDSSDSSSIEQDLRDALSRHQDFIENLPATEEHSRDAFMEQLRMNISSLGDSFKEREVINTIDSRGIRIVSLDFNKHEVDSILDQISSRNPELTEYLGQRGFERMRNTQTDDDDKKQDRFIQKTHTTFAHAQCMSQREMKERFNHIIDKCCEVNVNGILFDDEVAALDVSIPVVAKDSTSSTIIPAAINEFTHITIWCAKGVKAFTSNFLPERVDEASAKKIELDSPITIKGKFSFWHED